MECLNIKNREKWFKKLNIETIEGPPLPDPRERDI